VLQLQVCTALLPAYSIPDGAIRISGSLKAGIKGHNSDYSRGAVKQVTLPVQSPPSFLALQL
jgi:hypothetical protein